MKSSMLALVCCVTSILLLAQTENSSCEDLDTGSTTLYKDVFTGDVMFSGKYKKELIDDVMYEVYGNWVNVTNADPEVDIVLDHHLHEAFYEGVEYNVYFRTYMERVVARLQEHSPDQVDVFKRNLGNLMAQFDNDNFNFIRFYAGKSMDTSAMVALMKYKEGDGDIIPVMYFFKHGLVEENTE